MIRRLDPRLELRERGVDRLVLVALLVGAGSYCALVAWLAAEKPLGNDELFTLYFSRLPGFDDVWRELETGVEQTPPFFYLVTRASQRMLGDNDVALRLPELGAVLLAAGCMLAVVARRSTLVHGTIAALLLLATQAGFYAYEARPYALVLGFVALCFLLWQLRLDGGGPLVVTGLALAATAAVATHYYAVLALLPFVVAEATRAVGRRRLDAAVAGAFAVSLVPLLVAAPLIEAARAYSGSFWTEYSWRSPVEFNGWLFTRSAIEAVPLLELSVLVWLACGLALHTLLLSELQSAERRRVVTRVSLALAAVALVGLVAFRVAGSDVSVATLLVALIGLAAVVTVGVLRRRTPGTSRSPSGSALPEIVAASAFLAVPLVAVVLAEITTGAYTPRYALPAVLGVVVLLPLALHRLEGGRIVASLVVAVLLVVVVGRSYWNQADDIRTATRAQADLLGSLQRIVDDTDLAIAVADPHDFFVLSHYAPPALRARVLHLSDQRAALQYTGSASTEDGLVVLSRFAPLDVRRFRPYVESNPRFLLLLAVRQGNWVVRALERDGRALEPYPNADGLLLYEVR